MLLAIFCLHLMVLGIFYLFHFIWIISSIQHRSMAIDVDAIVALALHTFVVSFLFFFFLRSTLFFFCLFRLLPFIAPFSIIYFDCTICGLYLLSLHLMNTLFNWISFLIVFYLSIERFDAWIQKSRKKLWIKKMNHAILGPIAFPLTKTLNAILKA